ncbi:MAG: hypothetical protein E7594_07635 [Ruminococcaceae bacterium]|nr:hypothetical protein [Oscillospiraceae bacterium]MBE6698002.1 hypothetical protein [Oscillospiraceae bacterium]
MRRICILMTVALLLSLLCALPVAADETDKTEELYPRELVSVNDVDDLLDDEQEQRINRAFAHACDEMGIPIFAFVFDYVGRDVWGDDVLAAYGLDGDDDLVLMVVERAYGEYNYYMYTYGDAAQRINQKEIEYILDDGDVYDSFKYEYDVASGLCAFAKLSAQAYNGRLGVPWQVILVGALIIGGIAAGLSIGGIQASYKRKNPSSSYPLDRFAKLELTHRDDRVIGKIVTHTIISSGGGRGSHGGGRPGGGGGGGFRGGR